MTVSSLRREAQVEVADESSAGTVEQELRSGSGEAHERRARSRSWRSAPIVAGVLMALAFVTLIWTQLLPANESLWGDELFSVVAYVNRGPAGIWGFTATWVPNDHMLYELLTWVTVSVTGERYDWLIRLWAVVPTIAGTCVAAWWAWRRLGPWAGAVFAVLASTAPRYLFLGRGFGFAILPAAGMLIGADWYLRKGSKRGLLLFGASATLGIWSVSDFALAFLGTACVLMSRRALRRPTLYTIAAVGLVSILWYAPVLGRLLAATGQTFGTQLGWDGFIVGPVKDMVAPSVSLLLPGTGAAVGEIAGLLLCALGGFALRREGEGGLAGLLLIPSVFTYVILDVTRLHYDSGFTSFLLPGLMMAVAAGVVALGRTLPGRSSALGAVLAVVGCMLLMWRAGRVATYDTEVPLENYKDAVTLARGSGIHMLVTDSTRPLGFYYYFGDGYPKRGRRRFTPETPAGLQHLFCASAGPFVVLENSADQKRPLPDTSCLTARGATRIAVPERRAKITVWLVSQPLGSTLIPSHSQGSTLTGSPQRQPDRSAQLRSAAGEQPHAASSRSRGVRGAPPPASRR